MDLEKITTYGLAATGAIQGASRYYVAQPLMDKIHEQAEQTTARTIFTAGIVGAIALILVATPFGGENPF